MILDDKWSSIAVGAVPRATMELALGDGLVLYAHDVLRKPP